MLWKLKYVDRERKTDDRSKKKTKQLQTKNMEM